MDIEFGDLAKKRRLTLFSLADLPGIAYSALP